MSYGFISNYSSYPSTHTVMASLLHLNSMCRPQPAEGLLISLFKLSICIENPSLDMQVPSQLNLFAQLCAEQNTSANFFDQLLPFNLSSHTLSVT